MGSALFVLVGVFLAWGTIPLVAREAALPALALVVGRVWLGAAGLAVVEVARRNDPGPKPFAHRPGLCLAVGALLAGHWIALFSAYQRAPAGTVILVTYLAPIGVAVLAPRWLGEHITRATVVGLAVALAGAALIVAPEVSTPSASGVGLALLAAASFAVLLVVSKPLAGIYGGRRTALVQLTAAGLWLIPAGLFTSWGGLSRSWMWLVVIGLGHTAVGVGLYLWALARLPASTVGVLGFLEPVSVVIWAWVVLGEVPAWATVAGGAMIVVAGAIVVRRGTPVIVEVPAGVPG